MRNQFLMVVVLAAAGLHSAAASANSSIFNCLKKGPEFAHGDGQVMQNGKPTNRPLNFRHVCLDDGAPGQMRTPSGQIAQVLHQGEILIVATFIPGKKPDAPATRSPVHRHPADQMHLVLEGELSVMIEGKDHRIVPGGASLIPAGTPHATGNEGAAPVTMIEILVPQPPAFSPPIVPEGVAFDRKGRQPLVVPPGELKPFPTIEGNQPGESMLWNLLLDPERDSKHLTAYVAESKAGAPPLHTHKFEQFFFVTDGVLTVQLGAEKFDVDAGTLVKIPAGVPHTQWNSSKSRERHLVLLVPPPAVGDQEQDLSIKIEARPDTKPRSVAIY